LLVESADRPGEVRVEKWVVLRLVLGEQQAERELFDRAGTFEAGSPLEAVQLAAKQLGVGGVYVPVLLDDWILFEAEAEITVRPVRRKAEVEADSMPVAGSGLDATGDPALDEELAEMERPRS
jgi:hypothetical protein